MEDYSDYKECTDCVHYELCLHQEKFLIEHNRKDLIRRYGFGLSEPEICCNFRDRSRFVELPCKVGDKVYEIVKRKVSGKWTPKVVSRVVEQIEICDGGIIGFRCGTTIWISAASAFLTLEAAEQALKEREKDE